VTAGGVATKDTDRSKEERISRKEIIIKMVCTVP